MTQTADITAGRCGAPCGGRWCVLTAGHPLGRGKSHRATPRSDIEKAAARAFAAAAKAADLICRDGGPAGDGEPLCGQTDPELFFPSANDSLEERLAKKICGKCLVRPGCLQWALDHRELHGVWGGASERERRAMLRHHGGTRDASPGEADRGAGEPDDGRAGQDQDGAGADAVPARAWVQALMGYGIGWKRVAALAGLPAGVVDKLLYGRPGGQVTPETAAALHAVWPVLSNLADTAIIDSAGTRLLLQALVAAGWPQRWLARRLGWGWANFTTVMARRDHVAAGTAKAVVALYRDLRHEPPPEETDAQARAVKNARALAGKRGWKPLTPAEREVLSGRDADHGPGRQTGGRVRTEAA